MSNIAMYAVILKSVKSFISHIYLIILGEAFDITWSSIKMYAQSKSRFDDSDK